MSTSAPPELPTLIAASVWMKSSKEARPSCCRPVALTMPCVTVCDRPIGLPMASTTSPTLSRSERPKVATGTGFRSMTSTARSVSGSRPDDARIRGAAVRELHVDRLGVRDDVVVGDDMALRIDDDAGAEAALDPLLIAGPHLAEDLIQRGGCDALGHEPGRVDVDHGRRGDLHGIRIGDARRRRGAAATGSAAGRQWRQRACGLHQVRAQDHQQERDGQPCHHRAGQECEHAAPSFSPTSCAVLQVRCARLPGAVFRLCIMRRPPRAGNSNAAFECAPSPAGRSD